MMSRPGNNNNGNDLFPTVRRSATTLRAGALCLAVLLAAGQSKAASRNITWDPVTNYVDGTELAADEIDGYEV